LIDFVALDYFVPVSIARDARPMARHQSPTFNQYSMILIGNVGFALGH